MSKCEETIPSVQGIDFYLEVEDPEVDCDVDDEGREHRVIIENYRPNSVEVTTDSASQNDYVTFGGSGAYRWTDSVVVPKKRSNSPRIRRCAETAYSDDPGNTETLESTIDYRDILPMPMPVFTEHEDIDVDVC